MTNGQRAVSFVLCLCMLGGFVIWHPMYFWITLPTPENPLRPSGMLPLFSYCRIREKREALPEDAYTYQAIVDANRIYLSEQVVSENDEKRVGEETETALKTEKKAQSDKKSEKSSAKKDAGEETAAQPVMAEEISRESLEDYEFLLDNFFIVDGNTSTDAGQINAAALLDVDMSLPKEQASPQILIYHSHSQEEYADSRQGDDSTTVVGVGEKLASILRKKYGYGVLHVTDTFDIVDGELDRSSAYDYAREKVEQVLSENPSIEVVIDLHRDGVPEERRLAAEINGKPTAQFMFFNGLSYSAKNGPIDYLPNPHIAENLAFSFQMEFAAKEYYPGICRGIYLSSLRYNLHLKPRAILLEVGAQNNTVQEAKNAMEPFAWILNHVLQGE